MFGTEDRFFGRQFFHGPRVRGWFQDDSSTWHLLCSLFLISCCHWSDRRHWSAAQRLGTPAVDNSKDRSSYTCVRMERNSKREVRKTARWHVTGACEVWHQLLAGPAFVLGRVWWAFFRHCLCLSPTALLLPLPDMASQMPRQTSRTVPGGRCIQS